jgi:hypothetical protein
MLEEDMSMSRLDQALADVKPGETRVLEKTADPSLEKNRWYRARENFDFAPPGLFRWKNQPDILGVPHAEHWMRPKLGIDGIPSPEVEFSGRPDQLADMYGAGDDFFVSEKVFRVFQALDPESIESVEVAVKGADCSYHYCLCSRSLRALDERRTTIVVTRTLVKFEDHLFSISEDIDPRVHCFTLFHRAALLFSKEMLDAMIDVGARGLRFWPPFFAPQSKHTIRI